MRILLAWIVAFPGSAANAAQAKTAVMPLAPRHVSQETAQILDDILARSVEASGCCQVITLDDVNALLGFEKAKDALGCDDVACAVELGGALGVEYLLSGSVGRLGGELIVQLKLINTREGKVMGRGEGTVADDERLYRQAIETAVASMLGAKPPAVASSAPATRSAPERGPRLRFTTHEDAHHFVVTYVAANGVAMRCTYPVAWASPCQLAAAPAGKGTLAVTGPELSPFQDTFKVKENDDLLDLRIETRPALGSIMMWTWGGMALATGAALIPVGAVRDENAFVIAGTAAAVTGAGLLLWGFLFDSKIHVDYPGVDFMRK